MALEDNKANNGNGIPLQDREEDENGSLGY